MLLIFILILFVIEISKDKENIIYHKITQNKKEGQIN